MTVRNSLVAGAAAAAFSSMLSATAVQADETCLSPYMQKIIGHGLYLCLDAEPHLAAKYGSLC